VFNTSDWVNRRANWTQVLYTAFRNALGRRCARRKVAPNARWVLQKGRVSCDDVLRFRHHQSRQNQQKNDEADGNKRVIASENCGETGISTTVFSVGCPLVAATSGTDPDRPRCHVRKLM